MRNRGLHDHSLLDFGGGEVDTKSPSGKMLLTVFAAMAEFERSIMLVRHREGIAAAMAAGKYNLGHRVGMSVG